MQSRLTGAVSLMMAQAVVLVLGYVTHLWIGRVLGPAPYGIYGVVLSLQSIFGLFITLGVPAAIARFVAQDPSHARSILIRGMRLQLLVAFVVGGVVAAASPLLATLLGDELLVPYIAFAGVVIFSQAFYPIFAQYLGGLHKFNRQALLTTVYAIVKLVGALSLIYLFHVYGAFAGFIIGGVIAGSVGWVWTRRLGGRKQSAVPLRSFVTFAGTFVLILIALQLLISLDLFMVKALLRDNEQAGYYNAAVTLSRISYMLLQALGFILLPSVSKLTSAGAERTEAAVTFISDTLRYLIMLIVPSVALAATTSKSLIILFYSRDYIPAAPALTILMVGLGSLAFYLLLANVVAGAGRAVTALYGTGVLIVASGALGFWLIPAFGLVGAAWQTTIAGLAGLVGIVFYTIRTFGLKFPIKSTVNIVVASLVAIIPTYLWQATPITLFPQYALAGLLFTATLLLLKEVTPADRERLASLHPRLRWLAPGG